MLVDICANLLSDCYLVDTCGTYKDIENVMYRANANRVQKIILCCSTIDETVEALTLCSKFKDLYCTLGIHPMSISNYKGIELDTIRKQFILLANEHHYPKGKLIAFGEMGLDAFREKYVSLDLQKIYFKFQLELVKELNLNLPILFHCRKSALLFISCIESIQIQGIKGVVHSFSDNMEELKILLSTSFYIGLNGVAFREQETLEAIKSIPLNRVLLETDSPYCRISKSYCGYGLTINEHFKDNFKNYKTKKKYKIEDKEFLMKGRNEPCKVVEVYNAYCNLMGKDKNEIEKCILNNCNYLFWNK